MGSQKRRLERLEARRNTTRPGGKLRSPDWVYDELGEDARRSIEESLASGDEPIYRIAENGDIQYADGRPIEDWGDYIRALDERIAQVEREIAEEEGRL